MIRVLKLREGRMVKTLLSSIGWSIIVLLYACSPPWPRVAKAAKAGTILPGSLPPGYWQDLEKSDYLVASQGTSLLISYGGRVREVMTGLAASPGWERVCRFGHDSVFTWQLDGKLLILHDVTLQETHRLFRLQSRPAPLELNNFHVPDPIVLDEEKISSIRQEIFSRRQSDQESLRSPIREFHSGEDTLPWLQTRSPQDSKLPTQGDFRFAVTTTENTEYIRSLIAEVGWIDVARFGYPTSSAAFLLVQHSWDAPLMLAVLPHLKQDVDAGRMEADTYALMFDRLQLSLGHRQRYGSQLGRDETGAFIVLPTEDPSKVDSLRAGLGLIPMKDYVQVFGASEVKFSHACQEGS